MTLGALILGLLLADQPGPMLRLVIPESDTVVTHLPRHRFAGHTTPGGRVWLDGRPLRVYPTGAIAGVVELEIGPNRLNFSAAAAGTDTLVRWLTVIRTPPLGSSRRDTLVLEDTLMAPEENLWLRPGDILEARCKGTPGVSAVFFGDQPMQEIPPSETGGVEGIYRGIRLITDEDSLVSEPVVFMLRDSLGAMVTRTSRGRITTIRDPIVGVTRGERPYLNAGLGRDRLGGAKLEFLVPGVRLLITGKAADQYRVGLGEDMEAWIPEQMVSLEPAGTPPPHTLTGSWSVRGDGRYDLIEISLGEKLPWISRQESDPARIVIDLFGAVSNTNWISDIGSAREVRAVRYDQVGSRTFRVTIELAHPQIWGYAIRYRGTALEVRVRHAPAELSLGALTIAVDAGHGGSNEGAVGSTGALEKDINLATARHLRRVLEERGARVFMTRLEDRFQANSERLRRVIASDADLLVSVHANSIGMASDPEAVRGVSTYYRHPCYRGLAVAVLEDLRSTGLRTFGLVGGFNFLLNAPTELPTVLVEQAFVSHPEDEALLLDDGFRAEIAERIADGLERFLASFDE